MQSGQGGGAGLVYPQPITAELALTQTLKPRGLGEKAPPPLMTEQCFEIKWWVHQQ